MLNKDLLYKLATTAEACKRHRERMEYALDYLNDQFPVEKDSISRFTQEQVSHTDQLIYRFAQLQDTMGKNLFPLLLEVLGEFDPGEPFIDRLHRMEKLSLIESADQWLRIREVRNLVSHEYPDNEEERAQGLNELQELAGSLYSTQDRIMGILRERGLLKPV